jgi:hypothetical protein
MPTKPDPRAGKCTATSKRSKKLCDNWAMHGTTVCRMHGGSAGQVRAAAERRQQDEAAAQAVVVYGLPVEVDPHTALLSELWRTAGHVAWLRARIEQLSEETLHGPVGGSEHGYPREEAHVWVRLYQEERKHFAAVARDCIKAGIEERRIQLAEQQAELIASYTRALLSDLGIDPASEKARVAVRKHLTLVAGGAT